MAVVLRKQSGNRNMVLVLAAAGLAAFASKGLI
jgi:hypothetical protein